MSTSTRSAKFARTLLVLFSLLLIASGVSLVADERQAFKFKLDGGDQVGFEIEDLEIGETRQFFTEEGKEVLVTRTEDGLDLEVDGKKIDLGLHRFSHGEHGDGHVEMTIGEGEHHVRVHSEHEGDGEEKHVTVWVSGDDGDLDGEGEHTFTFFSEEDDARARLEESGVLDGLDEETRQKILDALESDRVHKIHTRSKVIVIDSDDETDEEG